MVQTYDNYAYKYSWHKEYKLLNVVEIDISHLKSYTCLCNSVLYIYY